MIQIQNTVTIARPVNEVNDFVVDLLNQSMWFPDIHSMERISGQTGQVGAAYKRVFTAMGKKRETVVRLTAYEPNKSMTVTSDPGPVQVTNIITLEPVGGATKVNFHVQAKTKGLVMLIMKPFVKKNFKRNVPAAVNKLKMVVESRPTPTPTKTNTKATKATAKKGTKPTSAKKTTKKK